MTRVVPILLLMCLLIAPPATAETALERGAYLMGGIVACGNCHTPQTPAGPAPGMELAGNPAPLVDNPAFTAYAPNITPDKETGIGGWTKAELIRAIRDGRRPDGTIIGPPMPIGLYRGISDADADAIAEYVMSRPAVSHKVAKSVFRIPLPPYGPPVGTVADVPRDDPVRYGAYLAGPLGHCIECHTPMVKARPDFANQLGAGGFEFPGPWGVSVAANITPHPTDGIARHDDAALASIIRTGVRPDGTRLLPPMGVGYYATINDADMTALIAYLRSLKPLPMPR